MKKSLQITNYIKMVELYINGLYRHYHMGYNLLHEKTVCH